jgi:hypothetical protein
MMVSAADKSADAVFVVRKKKRYTMTDKPG